MGLLYRIIGDFFSYIGDIGDIGDTTMAGIKLKLVILFCGKFQPMKMPYTPDSTFYTYLWGLSLVVSVNSQANAGIKEQHELWIAFIF